MGLFTDFVDGWIELVREKKEKKRKLIEDRNKSGKTSGVEDIKSWRGTWTNDKDEVVEYSIFEVKFNHKDQIFFVECKDKDKKHSLYSDIQSNIATLNLKFNNNEITYYEAVKSILEKW